MNEKNDAKDKGTGNQVASIWRLFRRNKLALLGMTLILVIVLAAIFAPYIAPYDPSQQDFQMLRKPMSAKHWFGSDQMGRDIFSRILLGAPITLRITVFAVTIGFFVGTLIGLIGGYYGGMVDMVVVYLTDILLAFPGFLLALAVIAAIGPGITSVIIASGFSSIPQFIRIIRGSVLVEKEKDYVLAARAIGESNTSIAIRYIFLNCIAPIIIFVTLRMAVVVLIASGLSFLGLGAQPPSPEWGAMLSEGKGYLQTAPHISIFPGLAIMILTLGFNLLGDGLRDALDPRMKI